MNKNYFGFKFPSLGKYNNAEFSAWVSRVNSLAMATGADVLKCGEEILNAIAQKAGILLEMVNSTKASVLTAKIAQKDEEVNQLHRFIFNVVKAQQKAPIKSVAESADAVMIAITPYKEASTKPYQEQNQLLKGMIHDLGKLAEDVVEIQLGSAVEALTLTVAQMDVLLSQRSSEQISSDLGRVPCTEQQTDCRSRECIRSSYLCHQEGRDRDRRRDRNRKRNTNRVTDYGNKYLSSPEKTF